MQIRVRRAAPFSAARPILNNIPPQPFPDHALVAVDEASISVFGTTPDLVSVCSNADFRVQVAARTVQVESGRVGQTDIPPVSMSRSGRP